MISGEKKQFSRTRFFLRFGKLAENLCQTHADINVGFHGTHRSCCEPVATNYPRFCGPLRQSAEPILKRLKRATSLASSKSMDIKIFTQIENKYPEAFQKLKGK